MKFSGLILIVLMAASLLYNGNKVLELNQRPQAYAFSAGSNELTPFIQAAQGFSNQSPQIEKLIVMLDQLNKATQANAEYSNLISLPVVADMEQEPVAAPVKRARVIKYNYVLTMVFVSPTDKYAVIDGSFAREGETLANGAKVLSISKGSVIVSKQGVRQTVHMTDS